MEKYKKDEISIVWEASKCVHAGYCVKLLPSVYNPNETPWIQTKNATKEEIINQVAKCPSGALAITK